MQQQVQPQVRQAGLWSVKELTRIGIIVAVLCVCSWISIPLVVPITLQTLAVFLAVGLLGRRDGTIAILVYLLLGAAGLPVFSGMRGGAGMLLGPTGGYLVGFVATGLVSGSILRRFGMKKSVMAAAFLLGLVVCYAFGTVWFLWGYARIGESISLFQALGKCVVPFCIPDAGKILLAVCLVERIKPRMDGSKREDNR